MQFSFSFVAFVLLSAVAALPQDTPVRTETAPKDTIYFIPTPAHVVADRNARILASANSTSLAKRSVHCVANNVVTSDAINVGTYIQGLDNGHCTQTNGVGSFCTQMACYNTACVDICGPYNDWDICLVAGNGLLDVANSCQYGNGVTGGWCDGINTLNYGLYHS
ncbi:hypothetical protein C8F04DRAFT_1387686 [Mycena alexandri]|uniref:Uncharacterized protein n=1 Tax=Mycena alexandri TaxID=1745969 RepID=A0AAD6XGH8_9AGAR|nr:hypothetical protein C8F04DRAFT_1387686 [Mycena alexandri]